MTRTLMIRCDRCGHEVTEQQSLQRGWRHVLVNAINVHNVMIVGASDISAKIDLCPPCCNDVREAIESALRPMERKA